MSLFIVVLLNFIIKVIEIYFYIIIARALLSFFIQDFHSNPLLNFVYRITEPLFEISARLLPFLRIGPMDFSIIPVMFLLQLLINLLSMLVIRIRGY